MLICGVEFAPGASRREHRRAWRHGGFLASADISGQIYWDAEALCYYPAHQHTQQGSDYRFGH
jgi:hypothetical protein